jgi:hypothetical protein
MGAARQLVAGRCAPDRSAGLRQLNIPTLVIRADDPLVKLAGGEDRAAGAQILAPHIPWATTFPTN